MTVKYQKPDADALMAIESVTLSMMLYIVSYIDTI